MTTFYSSVTTFIIVMPITAYVLFVKQIKIMHHFLLLQLLKFSHYFTSATKCCKLLAAFDK